MKETLQQVAGIIGVACYLPLIFGIIKNRIEQSFLAFLLWAMLDIIATVTSVIAAGNFWLPLSNAVGASVVAILLAMKKKAEWTLIETFTAVLVLVCLTLWYFMGETAGIVSSSLAVVFASLPQMAHTYKKPHSTPTGIYTAFLFTNILSLLAGKDWTFEERFYPACAVFLCLVIVILSLRKRPISVDKKGQH